MSAPSHKVLIIAPHLAAHVVAKLAEQGIGVICSEPQETAAKVIARGLLNVQAKQIGKGYGKEARAPWFRQFEKRRRHGR